MSGFNLGEWRSLEEEAKGKRGTGSVFMTLFRVPFISEGTAGGANTKQDWFVGMGVCDPTCGSQEGYIQNCSSDSGSNIAQARDRQSLSTALLGPFLTLLSH